MDGVSGDLKLIHNIRTEFTSGNYRDLSSSDDEKALHTIDPADMEMKNVVGSILIIMLPSFFNLFLTEIMYQINIANIGHLGNDAMLAGVGLSDSIVTSLSLSITYGTSTVLETLVS